MLLSTTLQKQEAVVERRALAHPFDGMFVWDVRCQVGESPVWDVQSGRLLWIDVRGQTLFRLDPDSRVVESWALAEVVGAVGVIDRKRALVALKHQLAVVDLSTNVMHRFERIQEEPLSNRLNEGKFSPSGAWFVFGSMDDRPGEKSATGSLYRADKEGGIARMYTGLAIANGIAWSLDGSRIYFSDSYAGQVFQAEWDEQTGVLSKPSIFVCSDNPNGRPDGALVDSGGAYLSAGVSAGCLNKFDSAGDLIRKVLLPLQAPTMPCIGGVDMSRLFVTSLMRPGAKGCDHDGYLLEMPLAHA